MAGGLASLDQAYPPAALSEPLPDSKKRLLRGRVLAVIDPWNPTPAQIRSWAFDPDKDWPTPDWDLALSWLQDENLFLTLATDIGCPNRLFFLSLLYFIVGNAVRTNFRDRERYAIEGFINRGDKYPNPDIELWQQRSRALLAGKLTFNYDDWCGGRLVSGAQSRDGG